LKTFFIHLIEIINYYSIWVNGAYWLAIDASEGEGVEIVKRLNVIFEVGCLIF